MRSRMILVVAIAAGLLLTGCTTPSGPGGPSDLTTDPSPSASETAEAVPAVLVVSLDGVSVLDESEVELMSATFDDGSDVLSVLGAAFGSVPAGVANADGYPITSYEWDNVTLNVVTDAGA